MKSKLARNKLENRKNEVAIKLQKQRDDAIKSQEQKEDASYRIQALQKTKLIKQYREAKKDLKIKDTGEPLVVNQNTKELIKKIGIEVLKHNKQQHLKNVLQNKKKLLILLNLC